MKVSRYYTHTSSNFYPFLRTFQNNDKESEIASSAHVQELLNPDSTSNDKVISLLADSAEWKSTYEEEGGLFTLASRPETVKALYAKCETIPRLDKLQVGSIFQCFTHQVPAQ